MKTARKTFRSYGGHHQSTCDTLAPRGVSELREALAFARRGGRTLSLSGAGLSFDNQHLSDDLVVSTHRLDTIRVLPAERAVEVGPGARWGDILRAALAHDLIPYVMATCSRLTAGGTASAHTNSLFSPCCGKEGKHILEVDLMLADGSIVTCSREHHRQLFYGVISGFGALGALTRLKYRLLDLRHPSRIRVETTSFDDVADLEARFRVRPGEGIDDVANVWGESSLFYFEGDRPRFTRHRRRFVRAETRAGRFNPYLYLSVIGAAFLRFSPGFANRLLTEDCRRPDAEKRLLKGVDEPYYGTFFAEPEYLLHQLLGAVGYRGRLYQNSYFIPLVRDQVTRFTQRAMELMQERGLHFAMFDVMYIPRDEPFLLSASRDGDGFYVNTTFLDTARGEEVMAYYADLNALCVEMGGRINLVKNAFIEPAALEKMYEGPLEELTRCKRDVDPGRLFDSLFLREKFPSSFGRA